jgi:hypothetical protein
VNFLTYILICYESSPGRFHAALLMKLVLVHMLTNFDMDFANQNTVKSFQWGSVIIPTNNTKILLKRLLPQADR